MSTERFLTAAACRELLERAKRLSVGGGDIQISVRSRSIGSLRWARNEITTTGDTTDHSIAITRVIRGAAGMASTSRIDDTSLRHCLERAEHRLRFSLPNDETTGLRKAERYLEPSLWSAATFAVDAAARADAQRQLVEPVIAEQLLSSGYVEIAAIGNGVVNTAGLFGYAPETRAEFSVTVRNSRGTASGWAGAAAVDWRVLDPSKLSQTALDKCRRSADPVAIEPGRYTVVLEPQAVAQLMAALVDSFHRAPAEMGQGPWAERDQGLAGIPPMEGAEGAVDVSGMSRIGQLVLDPRITIRADPADPEIPFVPFAFDSSPMRDVTWIENGVLKALSYSRQYALTQLNRSDPLNNSLSFRMSGGPTSLEEMIATTERGLLITRFVNSRSIDFDNLLMTGTTSDGVWLIERGVITKAVKNFRFRDSPLYVFNSVDAIGSATRVLMQAPAVAPAMRIRDFSLTSLADAV